MNTRPQLQSTSLHSCFLSDKLNICNISLNLWNKSFLIYPLSYSTRKLWLLVTQVESIFWKCLCQKKYFELLRLLSELCGRQENKTEVDIHCHHPAPTYLWSAHSCISPDTACPLMQGQMWSCKIYCLTRLNKVTLTALRLHCCSI